jgi:tetratricopeptide (TPR) repeat protein
MLCWGLADLAAERAWAAWLLPAVSGALLGLLAMLTSVQVSYWRDSVALGQHTLEATGPNAVAHQMLGNAALEANRLEEAAQHLQAAVALNPHARGVAANLALALLKQGRLDEALEQCRRALELNPNDAPAHEKRGLVLLLQENYEDAARQFTTALELEPEFGPAHANLGLILMRQGDLEKAVEHLEQARRLRPWDADVLASLGAARAQQGAMSAAAECYREAARLRPGEARFRWAAVRALATANREAEALAEYREARRLDPDWLVGAGGAAWWLATDPQPAGRNAATAVTLAEDVCRAGGQQRPELLDLLAAAYAEAGRFGDAAEVARRALSTAEAAGQTDLAGQLRERLRLYEEGRPFRQTSPRP